MNDSLIKKYWCIWIFKVKTIALIFFIKKKLIIEYDRSLTINENKMSSLK